MIFSPNTQLFVLQSEVFNNRLLYNAFHFDTDVLDTLTDIYLQFNSVNFLDL